MTKGVTKIKVEFGSTFSAMTDQIKIGNEIFGYLQIENGRVTNYNSKSRKYRGRELLESDPEDGLYLLVGLRREV